MSTSRSRALVSLVAALLLIGAYGYAVDAQGQAAATRRPMTFLDMQTMRQMAAPAPSPDGRWMLYTISTPDWKEAKRQTDIYLVSLRAGRGLDAGR